jgi:hypothetical protein
VLTDVLLMTKPFVLPFVLASGGCLLARLCRLQIGPVGPMFLFHEVYQVHKPHNIQVIVQRTRASTIKSRGGRAYKAKLRYAFSFQNLGFKELCFSSESAHGSVK